MPKDKSETYQRIVPAAKSEFLSKGFETWLEGHPGTVIAVLAGYAGKSLITE